MARPRVPLLAAALLAAGCGWLGEPGGPAEVAVATVRDDLVIEVPARGELESLDASPIAVPRVPTGALKVKQLVDEGTVVEPGDLVIVFDPTELNVELDNHRASFRSTNRRIDGTQFQSTIETGAIAVMREVAELERDNISSFEIVDEEIYSRKEILEDEVRLDNAEETIVFADASLLLRGEYYDIEERILDVEKGQVSGKIERVETSLGQLVLHAPIGGLVVYKKNWRGSTVGVGDTLWPGNVIMSIVDPKKTALRGFVLERDAAGLAAGAAATVRIDARPDRVFEGRVSSVAELSRPIESGSPVKYCEVQIELLDPDVALLKPGMKGEARIVTGKLEDVVVVPRSALRDGAEGPFVRVAAEGGGEPERRAVKLGPGDLVRVSVEEGLRGGERVLLGGAEEVAEREARTSGGGA
jgi:HlyD family secretion protein